MLHFDSDYMEGALPAIMQRLAETNLQQTPGYGTDEHCQQARQLIRQACDCPQAGVHFLVGGTQTNAVMLDQLLQPWEGVLAASTGHVAVHEAGAIEACGHKVITLPHVNGKLRAADVREHCQAYAADENREHMVAPGVLYISHPSEYGTLYSLAELEELRALCDQFGMRLMLDGARLGYGLAGAGTNVTLPDIARLCDAFYIGGTKVGALFGEAAVFTRPGLDRHFFTLIKKRGALLAKGRLLGLQFATLFQDDRYLQAGKHAVEQAQRIAEGLRAAGYQLAFQSPTNQQFVVLDRTQKARLEQHVTMGFWEQLDENRTVMRLATSWATRPEDVDALLNLL